MTQVAERDKQDNMALLENVLVGGDLSKLTPKDRLNYYAAVCKSVGLNHFTKPFEYITLNGKLTLYAKRDCTDQLRSIKGISCRIVGRELIGDIYVVTTRAHDKHGREDEATGAVAVAGLKGADLANAYMKAETKSKRRVTLSLAGLGMLDETEVGDIDPTTAVLTEHPVVQMPKALPKANEKPADKPAEPGPAMAGTINQTQATIIRKTLERGGKDEAGLCKHFGIESVEALPMAKINEGLAWCKEAA